MEEKILVTRSSMPPIEEFIEMITPLWDSHWLTNMGKYHNELEEKLKEYLGVTQLSLVSNGHMALEMALQMMNLPKGSEVITTPFTFVSTTHAIIRSGLVPVFCDIKDDYTIDEEKIENLITEKTSAILPVHVYGNPCNVKRIREISCKYDLKVIYDAAHAFGEEYCGKGIGTYGNASIFSFHATKVYNTIEGGAICCHLKEEYEKLYNMKNFGIRSEELIVSVGTNAKMNELQSAMGICNLKYIDKEIEKRRKAVNTYIACLKGVQGLRINNYPEELKPNYAYFPVLFEEAGVRDRVYEELNQNNIFPRKYFYPLTADAACFKNKYKNLELGKARYCSERVLSLPLYADLEEESVERIAGIIKRLQ